jgi:hypothetical protein
MNYNALKSVILVCYGKTQQESLMQPMAVRKDFLEEMTGKSGSEDECV